MSDTYAQALARRSELALRALENKLTPAESDELIQIDMGLSMAKSEEARSVPEGLLSAPAASEASRAFAQYLRTAVPTGLTRAQGEGVDTTGGFLVPDEFVARMIEKMKAFGGIASVADSISTGDGRTLEWPTVDDTANTGEIVAEHGTFAAGADLVFGTAALGAYKYMAGGAGALPLKVSYELLQDAAFDVEAFVSSKLGQRMARLQAAHWATGTGVGQPQGLTVGGTVGTTLAALSTLTYNELVDITHDIDPAYREAGSVWVMNDSTLAAIEKLVDGNDRPLLSDAGAGIAAAARRTLLGYPVVIDQAMPSMGAGNKFLAFGNIKAGYVIRRVKDISVVALRERYAEYGQVGYFAWGRADAVVQDANAFTVVADHA